MAPRTAPAKRLAKDLRVLYTQPLPLYYLWADPSNPSSSLTSLDILLAGPPGTPYSSGLYKLHLDIPPTYPINPPKAFFRTKIFHPNVEPSNGAVCLETLKRDWRPELTLTDILATIACLLIQPNPDSALNEEAGKMIHDGFERFQQHARLMTSIHAKVPAALRQAVGDALARGEEKKSEEQEQEKDENVENAENVPSIEDDENGAPTIPRNQNENREEEDDDQADLEDKENDASLSPTPVVQSPSLPIRTGVKRPLGDLPTPTEDDKENENENEKNIAANAKHIDLAAPSNSSSKSAMLDPVKQQQHSLHLRQGLSELSNQQFRMRGMMPPPAKKQATIKARMGIRRL